jgi:hypothetical protein
MENQSFRAKGSWAFFFNPFLPFDRRLFLGNNEQMATRWRFDDRLQTYFPTAMIVPQAFCLGIAVVAVV